MNVTCCNRCGRPLTDPDSIKAKYGPVCLAEVQAKGVNTGNDSPDAIAKLPFDTASMDVVCKQTPRGAICNIPQAIELHSPTGMSWGYGGSGPADFALNILYRFTGDRNFSELWHQEFKREFVATLPSEGGTIPGRIIIDWIQARRVIAHSQLRFNLGGGQKRSNQ